MLFVLNIDAFGLLQFIFLLNVLFVFVYSLVRHQI